MSRFVAVLSVIALVSNFLPVRASEDEKPREWPEDSAMSVGLRANAERDRYMKQIPSLIDRIGLLLKEQVPWYRDNSENGYGDLKRDLLAHQKAWSDYVNAECEFLYKFEGGPNFNTWASTKAARCHAGQYYKRLQQLRRAEKCLRTRNRGAADYYFADCLYQLAPISLL